MGGRLRPLPRKRRVGCCVGQAAAVVAPLGGGELSEEVAPAPWPNTPARRRPRRRPRRPRRLRLAQSLRHRRREATFARGRLSKGRVLWCAHQELTPVDRPVAVEVCREEGGLQLHACEGSSKEVVMRW